MRGGGGKVGRKIFYIFNKIATKTGFCYLFRYLNISSKNAGREREKEKDNRAKSKREDSKRGAHARWAAAPVTWPPLCPAPRWRRAWRGQATSVASKLRLRADVCIVGGARLDLPSRLRERDSFFSPPLSSLSSLCARVSLSLSLSLAPSSLFCPSVAICHPRLRGVCRRARVVGSVAREEKRARVWCSVPRFGSRVCSERRVPLREEAIHHAVAKW